jgi:signal transduction histidine kinase
MTSVEQILFEKVIYAAYFFPLALSGVLIWFLVFYIGRKHRNEMERKNLLLKQQALIIEKQRAVEHERNRIAAEMHDDLGSGLTRIKYLSERAVRKAEDTSEAEQIQRIAEQSNQLVTNMSEIIWAMNSRFDTAENLIGYIRRYASEYLEDYHIALSFKGETTSETRVTAEKRRNIFLVVKEILHNAVKYSGSSGIRIEMTTDENLLTVLINEEGGKGFDPDQASDLGNGLYNMQKRMTRINGLLDITHGTDGMQYYLTIPLETQNL